jgi:hypothetical protein
MEAFINFIPPSVFAIAVTRLTAIGTVMRSNKLTADR